MNKIFEEKNHSQPNLEHQNKLQSKYEEDLFFDWFTSVLFDETGQLRTLQTFTSAEEVCEWLYPETKEINNAFLSSLFNSQRGNLSSFSKTILEKFFKESQTVAEFQNKITDTLKAGNSTLLKTI